MEMQVLIVDDDIATVDVIKDAVNWERLGVSHVFTAYNMEQAKAHLQENEIPVIISDIEMPQGSGIDLLAWFRSRNLRGEFLFLTSHESFDYATNAIKLHAAEYLLKPFDVAVMEAALKKIILKIEEEWRHEEEIAYGQWAKKNRRQVELSFWAMVLDGRISDGFKEEVEQRGLTADPMEEYRLVVSRVTDIERDKERINPGLIRFIMENIHSEVLCGNPENTSVVFYEHKDYYIVVTICRERADAELERQCRELIMELKKVSSAMVTCCITRACKVDMLCETLRRGQELLAANVAYYGGCFFEEQATQQAEVTASLFDFGQMVELLEQKNKLRFMGCVKDKLNEKVGDKTLNEQLLRYMKQEVQQIVYAYFAKKGIQGAGFFLDEPSVSLTQKSTQSAIDMVRWVNSLLRQTYEYEEEALRGQTVIDKIHLFIHQHYRENIGRNEIAAELYLAPEYVSRMYKKQTGTSLTDYISEYRIEQAKLLLKNGELRISDVAENVGFDSVAYFSTMFKKYTGMTPNQYRKQ